MATYFWVGGAGTWDSTTTTNWSLTSGGAGSAGVPIATDTATFNVNSGTGAVSIAASATCVQCNFGGAGITATLTANHTVTFGGLNISAGTFDCSTFSFNITTGAVTNHTGGTFTCNGGTFTCTNTFNSSPTVAGTINLNNSTLVAGSITVSGTGLIFNAGTSLITLTSNGGAITATGITFYNVNLTGSGTGNLFQIIGANNTFNNLSIAGRSVTGVNEFSTNGNITINGTFTVSAPTTLGSSRLFIRSNTSGTPRTITAAAVSLTDVDFRDVVGAGTASWTGSRFGDCGGNTNITFPSAKTVYWNVAGSQNYSATGWATTETGSPAATNFPLPQDTAIFTDTNPAASSTITVNSSYNLGALDFSVRTLALTFTNAASNVAIYRDVTLSSAITLSGTGTITYAGRNTTQTITSAGRTFNQPYTQTTIGGGVVFADAFITASTFTLTNGSLSTNYNVTSTNFSSSNSNTRSVTLGAMVWSLTGTGTIWNLSTSTNLTLTLGTSKIALTSTSTTTRSFTGGGLTYNDLEIGGTTGTSSLIVAGSNTFNTISSTKTVAHTILFTAGTTTTVANWTVTGTAGNIVTINSVTAASHNLVKTGGGDISVDYMNITWSNASP